MFVTLPPISTVNVGDTLYPRRLLDLKTPPKTIYYRGDISILNKCFVVSIVGSRISTKYASLVTSQLVRSLRLFECATVSGFMYGVDTLCHENSCIDGIPTCAVLPCSIDKVYPERNKDLYTKILANGGLIISEYQKDVSPKKWVFPKRNRIVAALSDSLFVIEAKLKSGSVLTGDMGLKLGRRVFAVPGPITVNTSVGCLALITRGALPYISLSYSFQYNLLPLPKLRSHYHYLLGLIKAAPQSFLDLEGLMPANIPLPLLLADLISIGFISQKGNFYYAV